MGADIEATDDIDNTSLICASFRGRIAIVKLLLEYGANINVYDSDDESCLDYCVKLWRKQEIQELIINKQPQNIKFFDDKVGILPELRIKYKEIIELSHIGLL